MNKQYRVLIEYEDETVYPIYIATKSKELAVELIKGRFKYTPIEILEVEEVEE